MPAILITGCSSGFGLETAKLFLEKGWDVIATMRTPDESLLPASGRLRVLALDVTVPDSISRLVKAAGEIDVLVNNAGFGAPSPVELTASQTAQALFQTNTIGTLAMIQAVAPQMRRRRAWRHYQRYVLGYTETASGHRGLSRQQGRSECAQRVPCD